MKPKLANQLDQLDAKLAQLLDKLKAYSNEDLNQKPSEGSWSVVQVMVHLMKSEELSVKYIEKKLSFDPKIKKRNMASAVRSMLVSSYLKSPLKRQAPEAIGDKIMPEQASFWELAKHWKEQRQHLRSFIDSLPEQRLKEQLYKHPFAGRMPVDGMLNFFNAHFNRHLKQINRVLQNFRY